MKSIKANDPRSYECNNFSNCVKKPKSLLYAITKIGAKN